MANRRVTQTRKDTDGDITALCNPGEAWSPRAKADAVRDIETGNDSYYVHEANPLVDVNVIEGQDGSKHLRTTADSASANNLDNLPDC